MAFTPTIPTSFVPRQPVGSGRPQYSGRNYFLIGSIVLLGVMVLLSGAVFAYNRYLTTVRDEKLAALNSAKNSIDTSTVEGFIRLQNRLASAQTVLNDHIGLSQFFNFLEQQSLQTIRYNSLNITVADDRTATVVMTGTAKTFNSLAAQSSAFAQNTLIKRAIFSSFVINKDNTVDFSLTFGTDKSLTAFVLPTASTTPVGTTTTP